MEKKKRGPRTKNFNARDVELLTELTDAVKDILENKKSDASVWESKNWAWQDVCKEFNRRRFAEERNVDQLKSKYECIKKDRRKNATSIGFGPRGEFPLITPKVEYNTDPLDSDPEANGEFNMPHKKARNDFQNTLKSEESSSQLEDIGYDSPEVVAQKLQLGQIEHQAKMNILRLEERQQQLKIEILEVELATKKENLRKIRESQPTDADEDDKR